MIEELSNSLPFEITNPYTTSSVGEQSSIADQTAPQTIEVYNYQDDRIILLADNIAAKACNILFPNYETQVNKAGIVARVLDWGVFIVIAGMQAIITIDNLFSLHVQSNRVFAHLPFLLKVIAFPSSIFFFVMGLIEGFSELANLRRVSQFLYRMETVESSISKLEWLKRSYFTLNPSDTQRITNYIEKYLPNLSQTEKEKRFEIIAKDALKIKFGSLKRRISSKLAKEVLTELNTILADLKSNEPTKQQDAIKRTKVLASSISQQAKNKIIVHILALTAIGFTILSMAGIFIGFGTLPFFITMGACSITFIVLQILVKKGVVGKAVENLYDRLSKVNLNPNPYGLIFDSSSFQVG